MKIFPVIVKRITQAVGGTAQWLASVKPGISLSATASGTPAKPSITAGISVAESARTALVPVTPAVQTTPQVSGSVQPAVTPALAVSRAPSVQSGTQIAPAFAASQQVSGVVKPNQIPALAFSTSAAGTPDKPATAPAVQVAIVDTHVAAALANPAPALTQVVFTLVHNRGGVTATTTTTGTAWTTPANAQGDKDTTKATATGEVLGQTKTLKLDYADLTNKSSMTITAVKLIFYSKLALAVAGDTVVDFERSLDGGTNWTTLATVTADFDELVSGRSFTLSPVPTLAEVQAIQARMTVIFPAAAALKTLDIDAIHLQVEANETWLI